MIAWWFQALPFLLVIFLVKWVPVSTLQAREHPGFKAWDCKLGRASDLKDPALKGRVSSLEDEKSEEPFKNSVLYLVDEQDRRFLFRGKLPEINDKFCYEALKKQIHDYLEAQGKCLTNDFKLICISFLNTYESRKKRIEARWFLENSDKGSLYFFPLFGSLFNPLHQTSFLRNITLNMDRDGLQTLMSLLDHLMHPLIPDERDVVIYMHCKVGKDRTGEASACYLMQFKGYSYKDAIALNRRIARRELRRMSLNAIRWYAYYLRDTMQLPSIGDIN